MGVDDTTSGLHTPTIKKDHWAAYLEAKDPDQMVRLVWPEEVRSSHGSGPMDAGNHQRFEPLFIRKARRFVRAKSVESLFCQATLARAVASSQINK
jgi:hypothetical protein